MLLIKLSAEDIRTIKQAASPGEFEGVVSLIRDRILRAEVLKSFGKTEVVREKHIGWKEGLHIADRVLGKDNVTRPPFPTYRWFQRINSAMKPYGMDEAYITKLAEYARDHLRMPVHFDFLICQHQRILSGEFDGQRSGAGRTANTVPPVNPMELKLPEE